MNNYHMNFDEEFLVSHVGSLSQVAGLKRYILADGKSAGVEAVDVTTGSGLVFTVLPGRGMDIAWASYRGIPFAYMSKTGIVSPAYYESEGMNWLRSFFAGLLTTCGLSNVGNPCTEQHCEIGTIHHGLHGRISNSGAEQVCCTEEWVAGEYRMIVSGKLREAMLHGENITLRRAISCVMGGKAFTLTDTIKNEGMYDHHLMLLYHINVGYPLLDADSRVIIKPNETSISEGIPDKEDFQTCHDPVHRAIQRGYSHDLAADKNGISRIAIVNDRIGFGLSLEYEKTKLPKFNQWKMLSTGEYVMGLEPGTCLPISREELERQGGAFVLKSREQYETSIKFGILDGEAEITAFEKQVYS